MPAVNFVLVHRTANGRAEALSIGRVSHGAASLNLAEIRQRGAELGADEVHVHMLADNAKIGRLVEFDLRTGRSRPTSHAWPAATPTSPPPHHTRLLGSILARAQHRAIANRRASSALQPPRSRRKPPEHPYHRCRARPRMSIVVAARGVAADQAQ